MSGIGSSLSSWLHRPYLDLGPSPDGAPNHTVALEVDCSILMDGQPYPWFWSSLNTSFRDALIADSGLHRYDVRQPLELDPELRTERWQILCDQLDDFPRLAPAVQVQVGRLLNRMCFFAFTRDLIPAEVADRAGESDELAALGWLRAMAGYRVRMEGGRTDYHLAEFQHLAEHAPAGLMRINALYQMVVQNVKINSDLAATEHWQERHQQAIDEAKPDLDEHDWLMATSRSYRVQGFIPQMRRDADGVVRDMELAEHYALKMDFGTDIQRAYARELQYPVRESRIKEALWLGDLELALARAVHHRDFTPLDSRVWVHCGEVHLERDEVEKALDCFREAARLSPPGGEVARFMAGQCYEHLGQLDAALDCYLGALRLDPLGIGAAEAVVRVSEALGSRVRTWAEGVLHELEQLREEQQRAVNRADDAYRHLPAPESKATV